MLAQMHHQKIVVYMISCLVRDHRSIPELLSSSSRIPELVDIAIRLVVRLRENGGDFPPDENEEDDGYDDDVVDYDVADSAEGARRKVLRKADVVTRGSVAVRMKEVINACAAVDANPLWAKWGKELEF